MADNQDRATAKCLKAGVWGSVIIAICCFTPVLVIGLGGLGLSALTPYVDAVLFPMLAFFVMMAGYGFWRKKRQKVNCKRSAHG